MTEGSGLNMKALYLEDGAATEVATALHELASQLKELRSNASGLDTDLGMGHCKEGETWNAALADLVTGPAGSITAALDAFIAEVEAHATWAEMVQNEFRDADERGAVSLKQIDQTYAYPPVTR